MNSSFSLLLAHEPSQQIKGGYHAAPVDSGELVKLKVSSVELAAEQFCSFIGRNGLSGKNLPETAGVIEDSEGNPTHRVLFSGTVIDHDSSTAIAAA